ncbi:MAG: NTP/NDP exchange transporter [Gammaproteobacteria bacterium]
MAVNPITRVLDLRHGEWRAFGAAFCYFFFLLAAYYVLRPLREQFGVANGAENLQYLYTGTFVTMLLVIPVFGKLSSMLARLPLIVVAHLFFASNLFGMYAALRSGVNPLWIGRVFFVWLSVFNLFVVSLFWSFLVDVFSREQTTRLFGGIAAGGSLGALFGGAIVSVMVTQWGYPTMLPIAGALLLFTLIFVFLLGSIERIDEDATPTIAGGAALGGGIFDGLKLLGSSRYLLGVAGVMLFYTMSTTFLYFEQANLVETGITDPDQRTRFFANINLATNALALVVQFFVTGRLIRGIGLARTAVIMPIIAAIGLAVMALSPSLMAVAVLQALTRGGEFAVMKPVKDMLFAIVSRDAKYKTKNVVDTAVYRGGDLFTSWLFASLTRLGASLGALAWLGAGLATVWAGVAYWVGRRYERRDIR